MKNHTLFFGILWAIVTTMIIIAEFVFLDATYLNLASICFTSTVGYIFSALQIATYFETKKIKHGKK